MQTHDNPTNHHRPSSSSLNAAIHHQPIHSSLVPQNHHVQPHSSASGGGLSANGSDAKKSLARIPKNYTEAQLAFLRSHLPEFERRTQGAVRGDAKRFAMDRATEFIIQYGLPSDLDGFDDPEPRFKEQIYNWYKNTVGRQRRKNEGKVKSRAKPAELNGEHSWRAEISSQLNTFDASPGANHEPLSSSTSLATSTTGGLNSLLTSALSPIQYQVHTTSTPAGTLGAALNLNINPKTLCEAFLQDKVDPRALSGMIQAHATANPSKVPLGMAVEALFNAVPVAELRVSQGSTSSSKNSSEEDPIHHLLKRYTKACSFFPDTLEHAGVRGPHSGPRALQMQIRKESIWVPPPTASNNSTASMDDQMARIQLDRARRRAYIQWARIHAAALELDILDESARTFSEMLARDMVWEGDEVEWVAGMCLLRSCIRKAAKGGLNDMNVDGAGGNHGGGVDEVQKREYETLLKRYEARWKDVKDETRQAMFAEVLVKAKKDLQELAVN